jgi:membrane associated rhomboid family serine protease
VAFWAHIGGFVAGLGLIGLFIRSDYLAPYRNRISSRFTRKGRSDKGDGRWF